MIILPIDYVPIALSFPRSVVLLYTRIALYCINCPLLRIALCTLYFYLNLFLGIVYVALRTSSLAFGRSDWWILARLRGCVGRAPNVPKGSAELDCGHT